VIKSRRIILTVHVACTGERRGSYRALVGKPEGQRPLRRPKSKWEDNIKKELQEVEWIDLAQDRDKWRILVNAAMILRFL
jgi:hypothetical protein